MRPFLCKPTNSPKSGILLYLLIMVWYERTAFKRTYVNGLHVNIALRLDVSLQGFVSAQNSLPQTRLSMIFVFYLLTNLPSVFIGYWSVLFPTKNQPVSPANTSVLLCHFLSKLMKPILHCSSFIS